MSLSGALNNAVSGIGAAARAAELVSNNVANSMTRGYGPRELLLSSRSVDGSGAGVQVDGVRRNVDPVLISERRLADAGAADVGVRSNAFSQIEAAFGDPTQPGSLTGLLAEFEGRLLEAASRPEARARLDAAVRTAGQLVGQINRIADSIQGLRQQADGDIGTRVDTLNKTLEQIEQLNVQIFKLGNAGRDVTGLQDQRQAAIDSISGIVPLRVVPRQGGMVAIYTEGGATLLDGKASTFSFQTTPFVAADMSIGNGLSGLTLNGNPIATTGAYNPIGGGELAGLFAVRDELGPQMQADLDAFSRNLVERFQDPALDPTLTAGDAGLFTDEDAAFDPVNEVGLSGRLTLNTLVDPAAGGETWRLRDGVNAATPGVTGDGRLLTALAERLAEPLAPASGPLSGQSYTAAGLAADVLSGISTLGQVLEAEASFQASRANLLLEEELQGGVDTDDEMQKLLLIEQAYAANAKVIQTVDDLINQLMEI